MHAIGLAWKRYAHWLQGGRAILGLSPEGTVPDMFCRLCYHDYHLLRAYNSRTAPLRAYLRELLRRRVRLLRGKAARRVSVVPLGDHDQTDPVASGGVAEAEFHECAANLGPAEHELLAEEMRPRQPSEKPARSSPRARKLKQRLRRKIRDSLDQV